jgi:hypothetical protein
MTLKKKEFMIREIDRATLIGFDVVALYPSLKLEFMIREIDRAIYTRIIMFWWAYHAV